MLPPLRENATLSVNIFTIIACQITLQSTRTKTFSLKRTITIYLAVKAVEQLNFTLIFS